MQEAFLHHLWKYQLIHQQHLSTTEGEIVEIISPGIHNKHAGPDFLNAKIKLGQTIWAGNVEIHQCSSEWEKHGHHQDKAYNNVILQAVYRNDKTVRRANGELLPTLLLSFDEKLLHTYESLQKNEKWIPCQDEITSVNPLAIAHWLERISIERLVSKTKTIETAFKQNNKNWEETFYQKTARSFGLKINTDPFEMLARSIPYKILIRHNNSLFQLEALLFGQAGFLNDNTIMDEYYASLQKEYRFLRHKYKLQPIEVHLWKFLRLRPVNFPTIRIAQLAALFHHSSALFSEIIHLNHSKDIFHYFNVSPSTFWHNHYTFRKDSPEKQKKTGKAFINTLIINTIVPFVFYYGEYKKIRQYKDNAIQIIESLPPENNVIIRNWHKLGIKANNAFNSQALIELKNRYCDKKKCLDCEIGGQIIRLT